MHSTSNQVTLRLDVSVAIDADIRHLWTRATKRSTDRVPSPRKAKVCRVSTCMDKGGEPMARPHGLLARYPSKYDIDVLSRKLQAVEAALYKDEIAVSTGGVVLRKLQC